MNAGDIVFVDGLLDKQGSNAKNRRCVVIIKSDSGKLFVAAITSSFDPNTTAANQILIRATPGAPAGHGTSLTTDSVADCDWIDEVELSRVGKVVGKVPTKLAAAIINRIRERAKVHANSKAHFQPHLLACASKLSSPGNT